MTTPRARPGRVRTTPGVPLLLACALPFAHGCGGNGAGGGDGGPITVEASFGELGYAPGQFQYPRAMALVPADHTHPRTLVVIDKTARVQRIDPESRLPVGEFRMPDSELGKPTGVGVGPHPADPARTLLWVADTHYQRVLAYDVPDGRVENPEPVIAFGSYGEELGQFIYPTDVAIETRDDGTLRRVFVSEYGGNDRVTVLVPDERGDLKPVAAFGRQGNAGADDTDGTLVFHRPQDLTWDERNDLLVVADAINHRVLRLRIDDDNIPHLVDSIGGPGRIGRAQGQLDHPYSVALLDDGTLLVSEFGACRVQRFRPETGDSLGTWGVGGRREGELLNPWEIVVIDDLAWVLDSGNNRALAFDAPGGGAAVASTGDAP
ncbi:MAG: hypothetical protein ACF8Q5_03575 [Phycisphaerales bacterium JB040]